MGGVDGACGMTEWEWMGGWGYGSRMGRVCGMGEC